jgi:rod shape determining protein RodA
MASAYRSVRDLDWPLLLITLAICAVGVLQIYSATLDTKWSDAWWKQMIWVAAGVLLMWIVMTLDYHTLLSNVWILYGLSVLALIAVFIIGVTVFGAKRWIALPGGFQLQVSEYVKIVIVVLVARFMVELKKEQIDWQDILKITGLVGLPMLLVMKQPDLGTSLTYTPILIVGIFLAGLRWKYLAIIAAAVLVLLPASWFVLKDYQKARITSFLDPSQDPKGSGYQIIQSKIAIGQGGIWGRGVTKGTQTQLQFLPVPHTDFIFSAFAEEHGFLGVVVVLGLYFLLLMQIVQNAQTAPDRAGMYICMGVASLLLFHVLVNVGMVSGRMPVTGIPLPLMSSGGSNTLSTFILLGLVNSVRLRSFVN